MKNYLILVLTTLHLFITSSICTLPFEMSDYESQIKSHSSELILGETPTKKDARDKAERVWLEYYGDSIHRERPYLVYFDEENGTWLVKGTFELPHPKFLLYPFANGVTPHILIQKSDGKVLAVWLG